MSKPITIIQGGQWGSESKGLVAAAICRRRNVEFAVRTGSINAGHTVYHPDREGGNWTACKMQQLPTGWVNPGTRLVIGPGAYISPEVLEREIDLISRRTGEDARKRVWIDYRAGLHDDRFEIEAKRAGRHTLIGATGKGCAEAIMAKIALRGRSGPVLFADDHRAKDYQLVDTTALLNAAVDSGAQVLIEGTQGTHLDLHLGPYPYVTSRMTTAANWIAEAGLSPNLPYEIGLVLRSYPIRVAGNSGPMPLETTWVALARTINRKRLEKDLAPLVAEPSLAAFEQALIDSAGVFDLPIGMALNQHQWSVEQREEYAYALSNLNAAAIVHLKEANPVAAADLDHLFERTTVTQKLRRIALFDVATATKSCIIERPSWVAITFANYDLPWLWYADEVEESTMVGYARFYERQIPAKVAYIGFGPREEHLIPMAGLEREQ